MQVECVSRNGARVKEKIERRGVRKNRGDRVTNGRGNTPSSQLLAGRGCREPPSTRR